LSSDAQYPIHYDEELNEYNLASLDKRVNYRMYYCFFCGGRLPESKRASLFTEPGDKEMKEISDILHNVKKIEQAIELLGKPDNTASAPQGSPSDDGIDGKVYKRHYRYSKRWKTLDLIIREREDGSF